MLHLCEGKKKSTDWEGLPSLIVVFLCLPTYSQSVALGAGVGSASPGLGEEYDAGLSVITAHVNATYRKREIWNSELDENCHFCSWSRVDAESGRLVAIPIGFCSNQVLTGASLIPNPYEKWIALFDGSVIPCRDLLYRVFTSWASHTHSPNQVISVVKNASAIMIYGTDLGDALPQTHSPKHKDDPVSIMISKARGDHLASVLANGTRVDVRISVGSPKMRIFGGAINKTSMLFLSISFVVLMVISLAWLVFYYVQRSRYTHAKQRLSKRLMRAAKKAIGKMPLKTIYSKEDVETECDVCAICIEGYKTSDVVRILPCHHIFHKPCIDPWLVEQRSCPICKIDILKAFGMQVTKGHHQLHHNNPLDTDPASSSLMELPPLSGSLVGHESTVSTAAQREFDSDGVEIVRFHQVAQVEHHHPSASWSSSGGEEMPSSVGGNPSPTPKSISPAVALVTSVCKPAAAGCVHQRGGSSDSNSSGSVVNDEEVFHHFHHPPQHHHYMHLQPRQVLSQKPSGDSSVSAGSSSSSGASDNVVSEAVGCSRRQLRKKGSSASSSRASAEYLDAISDPSKHHAQEHPAAVASSRLPSLQSAAGDRALASASELQPLSERAVGEDCGIRRVSGVLFSKFPMETGL